MNTNENEMSKGDREYDLLCRVHFGEASEAERAELSGLLAASPELREQKAALEATAALVKGAYGRPSDGIGEQRLERVLSEVGSAGATIVPMKRTRLERPLEIAAVAAGLMAAAGLWIVLPGGTSDEGASTSMTSDLDSASRVNDETFWLTRPSSRADNTTTALDGFDPDVTPLATGGFSPDAALVGSVSGDGGLFTGDVGAYFDDRPALARGDGGPGQVPLKAADPQSQLLFTATDSYADRLLDPRTVNSTVGGGGGGSITFGSPRSYGGTYRGPSDTIPPPMGGGGSGPPPPPPASGGGVALRGEAIRFDRAFGSLQELERRATSALGGQETNGPGAPSAGFFFDDSKDGAFASTTQNFFEDALGNRVTDGEGLAWAKRHASRYPHVPPTRIPNERPRDMFFRFWGDNAHVVTDIDALSTFAADVDTASFALAERMLTQGIRPTREQIRTEEFVNYLTPDLAAPDEAAFAIHSELSPSPFAPGKDRYLLRVGVRAKEVAKEERPPLALTFVVDVSGSMEKENRLELVKHAMRLLGSQLEARDTISIVSFSNEAKLVLGTTPANRADLIEGALFGMSPGGGTNADAGLALGYQVAAAQEAPGAQRRVVFLSDGVANIGETDQAKLSKRATEGSEQRIFLNTIGVGLENHNDVFLEQLANEGDGVCDYVADAKSARRAIVDRFTGGFVTVAKDAKIQVEFDAGMVLRWRQLGYENRAIADKDFRNDAVDAAEIGAGHQVTCLYEVELVDREAIPRTEEPALAMVRVRWQPIEGDSAGAFTEVEAPVNFLRDSKDSFRSASHGFRRAALAAQLAECLRASIHTAGDSVKQLGLELAQLLSEDRHDDTARLAAMTKAAIDLGLVTRPALASSDPDSAHRRAYHEALIESLGGVAPPSKATDTVEEASAEGDLEEQLRELLRKRRQENPR